MNHRAFAPATALVRLPANFSSLVIFLAAAAATALGWIWLGEAPGPMANLGGALIFAGIWLALAAPILIPPDSFPISSPRQIS